MNKIGVLVNNLGFSQLNYFLIRNVNELMATRYNVEVVVFYDHLQKPCLPMNFASMQTVEAWGYDGTIIATSLASADKLIRFPAAAKKLFYLWDLEWLRIKQKSYLPLREIYCCQELGILARSQSHKEIFENCWNHKVERIVEDFDMKEILSLT